MITLYNENGVFLPQTLRKSILTIILKNNINQNSTTATRHYHEKSLSVFQFPTEENLGKAVAYGDLEHSSNQSSLKIDACTFIFLHMR